MGLKWLLSLTSPLLLVEYVICMRWLANPNEGWSHFPHNFKSSYEILFIITMKILVVIKWSYRSLPIMLAMIIIIF